MCDYTVCMCYAYLIHLWMHEQAYTRCANACVSEWEDAWQRCHGSISKILSCTRHPLRDSSSSLLFPLCQSFSWFDLRQNSIPQFHTLSAVDKGLAGCSQTPERDTACTQNGIKSNSSRQWGPFVELSWMKSPYLASHCFSHHLPVSHCQPAKNKSLF